MRKDGQGYSARKTPDKGSEAMSAGRPPKYKTPEEMQMVIDDYFGGNDKPTMAGLAYQLGMSRQALCEYKKKDEFVDTIKTARQRVEMALEENLYGGSVAGTIFNLKNNFGWKDVQERKHEGDFTVNEVKRTVVDPKHTDS